MSLNWFPMNRLPLRLLPLDGAMTLCRGLALELRGLQVVNHVGMIGGQSPLEALRAAHNLLTLGAMTGGVLNAAVRFGDRTALLDECGPLSYVDLDRDSNAIANEWRTRGVKAGDGVAILARNHRWLPLAVFAASKLGARIVLLNTDFAAPQIGEVAKREGVDLLVCDDEFATSVAGVGPRCGTFRAWVDADADAEDTMAALVAVGDPSMPPPPEQLAKLVVLTSGTTGTPKGAARSEPRSVVPAAAILERVPFKLGGTVEVCAPLFHSLGFGSMLLLLALGSTVVLHRRFDPESVLESIEHNRSSGLVAVPVMLQRMVDLGDEAFSSRDLSSLEAVLIAGSQLGGELATRSLERFGPVVHNMYGSTEVAYATIATPADLLAEPSCVGRACLGADVRILDDAGHEVAQGEHGRIFVRNSIPFDGYTGGGGKETIDGLMSSGDVGHFDTAGRLFIDGRDDDMIISGGENVFPREIEELLEHHHAVEAISVVGVPDASYGQRLRAFVVRRAGVEVTAAELQGLVRENLARYKVPREIVFVDELPRTATGKVLKHELLLLPDSSR